MDAGDEIRKHPLVKVTRIRSEQISTLIAYMDVCFATPASDLAPELAAIDS
jgi:hypothetical protein